MTSILGTVTRPTTNAEARTPSVYRKAGLVLAGVGLGIAMLSLIVSLIAGSLARGEAAPSELATVVILSFGLATAGFATVKLGIGVILVGIIRRLWLRVESIKTSLPALAPAVPDRRTALGDYESPFGPATATATAPKPLPIHRMAKILWAPMLVMGIMLVGIGLLLAIITAGNTADASATSSGFAWVQGLQFLGEGALLAGISFLLGSILGAIRAGGGEVQESLGLTVRTIQMPTIAKVFIGLMVAGVMLAMVQFLGYVIVSSSDDPTTIAASFAFLGPLRELSLGLLLAGIVLALATIAKVLGFQFDRINEIIRSGR
jgi:hypothetical protein